MDYDELRNLKLELEQKLNTLQKEYEALDGELSYKRANKEQREKNIPVVLEQKRTAALNERLILEEKPFLNKISAIEKSKNELKVCYDEAMQENNLNDMIESRLSNSPLADLSYNTIESMKEMAARSTSRRFIDTFFSNLPKARASGDSFVSAVNEIDHITNTLNSESGKFVPAIEDVVTSMQEFGTNLNKGGKLILLLGVVAILIASPFYLAILLIMGIVTYATHCKFYHALVTLKLLEDNYDLAEKAVIERVNDDHNKIVSEFDNEYKSMMGEYDQEIANIKHDMSDNSVTVRNEFVFDSSIIENNLRSVINNISAEITLGEKKLTVVTEKMSALKIDIDKNEKLMQQKRDELESKYLSYKVGDSFQFPDRFLLDMNPEPTFLEYKGNSVLCLYKDRNTLDNFIKLIIMECRCYMNASSLNVELWDLKLSAVKFPKFKPVDNKKASAMFQALTTDNDIRKSLSSLYTVFKRRLDVIKRDHENIREFNEFMLSQDSIPENYKLIFIEDIDMLKVEPNLMQIIRTGAVVGLYIFCFLNISQLSDQIIPYVDSTDLVWILNEDGIKLSNKDQVKKTIIAKKKQVQSV